MRFFADECCDADTVRALRDDDHDVLYVTETMPGALDSQILDRAYAENRILITEDKDFGELIYRLRRPAREVILLRFTVSNRATKIPRLLHLIHITLNVFMIHSSW